MSQAQSGRVVQDPAEWASLCRYFARERVGKKPAKIVLTSGGYDPLHVGHLRCIQASASLGEVLVVCVNGDGFLVRKKGYALLPWRERAEMVAGLSGVDYVVHHDDGTQHVAGLIRLLAPDVFAKGGDRSRLEDLDQEEVCACQETSTGIVLGVGGRDKPQSSRSIIERARMIG